MNSLVQKVISKMNISLEEYYNLIKDVDLSSLENPSCFKNIDIATERIKQAIKNNEKIMTQKWLALRLHGGGGVGAAVFQDPHRAGGWG